MQAKYIAQIVVTGVQIVGRAFGRALKQEFTASQAAAAARQSNPQKAATDAYTGMTIQVKNPLKRINFYPRISFCIKLFLVLPILFERFFSSF